MSGQRLWRRLQLSILAILLVQACRVDAAQQKDPPSPAPFAVKVVGTGRPMILIPGLSCGGNVWDGTVAHFKDRYECHVITMAGFAGQPSIAEPSLEKVRDGLIQYITDKKLDRPVLVGHSLGGTLAFWVGATAPDKVGPIIAVDGVPCLAVLLDPETTLKEVKPLAEKERDRMKAQTAEQFAAENRKFLGAMITDPEDVERVAALSVKSDPKTVGQTFYELLTTDLRKEVKAIRTPVLLIGSTALLGPDEKKKAEDSYRAQVAAVPRHKVIFAPRARHFIQLDEPKFFIREVEAFLKEAEGDRK
jgi:pimeloyl-ACP methyl ester carboxylesterase